MSHAVTDDYAWRTECPELLTTGEPLHARRRRFHLSCITWSHVTTWAVNGSRRALVMGVC